MDTLQVNLGQSADLFWDFINAQTVFIDQGVGFVPKSGQIKVKPEVDTTYTLTATGFLGDVVTQQIQVIVKLAPYITSLSSINGIPGDSIQVNGTDFDSDISNNIVEFQGPNDIRITGTVTNATANMLTVTVPNMVISGLIQVTTNDQSSNGVLFSVTSLTNFIPSATVIPNLINDHIEGSSFVSGNNIFVVAGTNPYIDLYQTTKNIVSTTIETLAIPRSGFPIVQKIGDFVYVVGGNDDTLLTQRYMEKYNTISDSWEIMGLSSIFPTPFNGTNRCGAAVGSDIFVFTDGATLKYNTLNKTWVSNLSPHPVSPILAKAITYNGLIYVFGSGGSNNDQAKSVYVYDPSLNSWAQLQNSPQRLASHAVSILNNHIIISGGKYNDTLLQIYNPATNTWRSSLLGQISPLPSRKHDHISEVVNGELYLLGGNDKQIIKLIPIP